MDFFSLQKKLARGQPAPVYLVVGEEEELVERAVAAISERLLRHGDGQQLARERIDGASADAAQVDMALRSGSLFAGRRLVLVAGAQQMRVEELAKLEQVLAACSTVATLLLQARGLDLRSRDPKKARLARALQKLAKAVEQAGGVVVECPRPRARDLPRWIERALQQRGLSADARACQAIADAVGEDIGAIERAAEKLLLLRGGPGPVDEQQVVEVVADTRVQNIFDLTDAVGRGEPGRALQVLDGALREGDHPLALLTHLTRHIRNLALVDAGARQGVDADELRRRLGLHPFVIKKCLSQRRRFSQATLARALQALAQADLALKSSGRPAELVLERLVLQLAGAGP